MSLIEKTFETKKDLFAYLHSNKSDLLEMKKASKKTFVLTPSLVLDNTDIGKANKELFTSSKNDTDSVIKRTVIGNTYNWLDSHGDVHVGNTFGKSISERANKVWHLHDHLYQITAKVGTPERVYEQEVKWTDLGVNKVGKTIVVMMDSNIEKVKNEAIFGEYKSGNIDQHSVGMYYVKVELAINDKDYPEEFKVFNEYIDSIGNKDKAIDQGYFYAVKEAKLIEISAVLEGSNELTPTLGVKNNEPLKDTHAEPTEVTQNKDRARSSMHFY